MKTPREYAHEQTGILILLPAGTRIGGRKKPATDAEAAGTDSRAWTGWEAINTETNTRLEVRIDGVALTALATKAARSKGRKAKSGVVTLKVIK